MATTIQYKLKQGETVQKVAFDHGIVHWRRDVWARPENKEIREKLKDPKKVKAGTVIYLPKIKTARGEIAAAVGASKRCPNRPEDVKTVKELLNRWAEFCEFKPLQLNGAVNAPFIKAVQSFQKMMVGKPSGVVAPKSRTLAALRQPIPKISIGGPIKVKVAGKEYSLTKSFVENTNKEISKSLVALGEMHLNLILELEQNCQDICTGKGKAKRLFLILLQTGNLKHFNTALKEIRTCRGGVERFISNARTTKTARLKKVLEARGYLQKITNHAGASFNKAMKSVDSSYQVWIDVLKATRDTSFAVVETYLSTVMANPVAAGAIAGSAKQAAGEVGTAIFLPKKWQKDGGVAKSVLNTVLAGSEGAAWSLIGGKILKMVGVYTTRFTHYLMSRKNFHIPSLLKKEVMELYGRVGGPNLAAHDTAEAVADAVDKALSTIWNKYGRGLSEANYRSRMTKLAPKIEDDVTSKGIDIESAVQKADSSAKSDKFKKELAKEFLKKYEQEIISEAQKHMKKKKK